MPDFPRTVVLTEFDGPDESPLSDGGRWASYGPPDQYDLRRTGGAAYPTTDFPVNTMFWTPQMFNSPCEVFICLGGGGLGAAVESHRVYLWKDHPDFGNGYLSAYGGGIGQYFFMRRYDNWSVAAEWQVSGSAPDMLGLRLTNTAIEQWAENGGVWSLIQSVSDTTHRGAFYGAIGLEEQGGINEVWIDCFGGGVENRQHIYRWLAAGGEGPNPRVGMNWRQAVRNSSATRALQRRD